MNITFLSPGLNKNRGGERVIFGYAKALIKKGHSVSIVVPKGMVFLNDKKINIIEYNSILSSFYSRQLGYIDAILPAIRKIPKNTDILIGTYVPQMIISTVYKIMNKGVKYIMFNQDFSDMFVKRPERMLMFKIYPKFADKIISISQFCADEVYKHSGKKSIVIRNGIENEYFDIAEKKQNVTDYIFWIGSKNRHKGYKEFWEAMNIVWEKYPNIKLYTTEGALDVNDNVEVLKINGNLNLLKETYRNALLFVCSSHSEGFGLPGIEAMSQGCPVVTTDTGGSREYAKDKYNSIVVPPKNSKNLAEAIISLLGNRSVRDKFSENGINTARDFNWDIAFEKFNQEIMNV